MDTTIHGGNQIGVTIHKGNSIGVTTRKETRCMYDGTL